MRGRHGRLSMSAIEWIGSSQVIRSRWGSSRSRGRRLERRVLDPRLGEPLDHAAVQAGSASIATVALR